MPLQTARGAGRRERGPGGSKVRRHLRG
ncbi:hypothetical protein TO73_2415 [Thermus aquaticus Y51MC23]|uniref:Uncharacterized protein n=1 Tax=Thermus aquaticus (strain ATCC BAA-2747 / Y51MC23) TaxID=498848 RepID=A0ABM5VN70_THEA5|nr:hypothetical protein TO73_2415 [Thermus aquaticus Y51MC23]